MIYTVTQRGNDNQILGIVNERTEGAALIAAGLQFGQFYDQANRQWIARSLRVEPGETQWW